VVLVDGPTIGVDDLPLELSLRAAATSETEMLPLNEASDRFERQIVLRTLDRVDGNVSEAARLLGLHRNSLKSKLDRWKIRPKDLGSGAQ
jgi:DNA-binding NtrC family response regulator